MHFFSFENPYFRIITGVAAVIMIAAVLWLLSRKALPKRLRVENSGYDVRGHIIPQRARIVYDRREKILRIVSPETPDPVSRCDAVFLLYPVNRRWTPSQQRCIGVWYIAGGSQGVTTVTVNGITVTRNGANQFVGPNGTGAPVRIEGRRLAVSICTPRSSLNCTLKSK